MISIPADVLFMDDPMTINKAGTAYVLSLRLPFTSKDELELSDQERRVLREGRSVPTDYHASERSGLAPDNVGRMLGDRLEIGFERRYR